MRKSSLLLLLLPLLLAACDDGYQSAPIDLYEAEAIAKRARAQTEEAAQITRQAVAQETRQAAKTRDASIYEMQLIDKQIEGTAIAYSIGATVAAGTAQVESARATQAAAAIGTATAWPMTAVPLQATQAAIAASSQYAEARANMSVAGDVIKFVAALFIMAWTIRTVVIALTNRYRVANTIYGPVAFDPDVMLLQALQGSNPRPVTDVKFREIPDVISLNRSGTVLASPPMSNEERTRRNLVNALKACNAIMPPGSNRLPRWDKIPGMTSEKWQDYVSLLEEMGYVNVSPSVGTFLVGGSVDNILYDLETNGKLPHLSPAD